MIHLKAEPPRHYTLLRWLGHQQWLRYGIRERILRRFCHPDRAADIGFLADFAGYRYRGDLRRLIDWIVYFYGAYEQPELDLMRGLLAGRQAPVALDVGANVGHHTLYLARFCAAVHAFEPYEGVRRHLEEKIRDNGLRHVAVHAVGLADRDATLEYFAPQGSNTGTGSFVAGHERANNRSFGALRVVRADDYIDSLALPRLDLVKIDVEGFETEVIAGLRRTLERFRPLVVMEVADASRAQFRDHAHFMEQFPRGYRADTLRSNAPRCVFFNRAECRIEPFDAARTATRGGYANVLLRPAP